ncbi:hypothetical protein [uncultured Amnibacterium sp.]|uniref:hypothetical protein n=1 Tax=uncultured Amnibacterium sp. TaxID=1631851 RepID=UPI0035CAFD7A
MSGQWFPGVAKLRRRSLLRRVALAGALLLVLVGLAVLWPRAERGGLTVPTATAGEPTGVLRGALQAQRHGDVACYSVTVHGTTSVLRFAEGWSANPQLGLVDPSGAVIAQPGSTVVLTGEPGAVGTADGCTQQGRLWTISAARVPPPT